MRQLAMDIHDEKGFKGTEVYKEGERGSFPLGHPNPAQWGKDIVANWNATLRPHESARTIDALRVTDILDKDAHVEHDWHKTNLVTVMRGNLAFDTVRCNRCGITGKRYGLNGVTPDAAFKAQVFRTCNGAQAQLARRQQRKDSHA